jgi:outer membrane protein
MIQQARRGSRRFGVAAGVLVALVAQRSWAEDLTAESSADRAVATSYEAAAARSAKDAADAGVAQATAAFLPRIVISATYTRLSDFTSSPLFPFAIVATDAPAGTASPPTVSTGPVSIEPILDMYAVDATLTVPITDYFLRLPRGREAAERARDAAAWDTVLVDAGARLTGKLAFYEWLRADAAVAAVEQSVKEQAAHLVEVTSQLDQNNATRADVLRVESAVASAEATLAEATAQRATSETRLRTVLHAADSAALSTPDAVSAPVDAIDHSQAESLDEAYRTRAELRGLDAAAAAARAEASVARATYVPTVGAFASATYANPNQRYFPPEATWHGTWAVGVALTWSPTDIPGARARAAAAEARATSLVARRNALRDAIAVEVAQSYAAVRAADAKVVATDKQLESASEAYRVTRTLFANARATTSNVLDAETDLARARLAWINARIDARVARARLKHAAGRDQTTAVRASRD